LFLTNVNKFYLILGNTNTHTRAHAHTRTRVQTHSQTNKII